MGYAGESSVSGCLRLLINKKTKNSDATTAYSKQTAYFTGECPGRDWKECYTPKSDSLSPEIVANSALLKNKDKDPRFLRGTK